MSCPGVRNLDSGPEHRFRQRRIGSRPLRNGRSTSPENTNPAPGSAANSRHCCTQAGYRSADTWNCQSQPWNRSQHHWLYAAIAERHARTKHNLAGVGDSWSNHSATRATGAQQSVTGARPHPLRIIGIQDAKFSAGSSVVLSEQFGTPAQAAE